MNSDSACVCIVDNATGNIITARDLCPVHGKGPFHFLVSQNHVSGPYTKRERDDQLADWRAEWATRDRSLTFVSAPAGVDVIIKPDDRSDENWQTKAVITCGRAKVEYKHYPHNEHTYLAGGPFIKPHGFGEDSYEVNNLIACLQVAAELNGRQSRRERYQRETAQHP